MTSQRDETTAPNSQDLALITQMRAGTHFLCAGLRVALQAAVLHPVDGGRYAKMSDDEISKGLNAAAPIDLPRAESGRTVYFSHYYHAHHQALGPLPRIFLIGFPFDSFYSDGLVFSDAAYNAGPSGARVRAAGYVFRFDSKEWRFLEPYMHQNARWLAEIAESDKALIVRYEDFFLDFDATASRLSRFVGGFTRPLPSPLRNPKRCYWTERYGEAFDERALAALGEIFAPAIRRFYPERSSALGGGR
jgi:hypothetical protein